MHQLQIIVPHGSFCDALHANGHLGMCINTMTPPGCGYDIQTWQVPVNPAGSYHVTYIIKKVMPEPARVR